MKRKLSLVCLFALLVLAISLFTACGGKDDPETCEHTFGEWQTTAEATCTVGGKLTHTCTKCDFTEEKTTEAKGHTGGSAKCNALAVCTVCNEEYGTYADHVYNVKNTDPLYKAFPSNCTDAAAYYYTCACGEKGTETFTDGDPLGHSYITVSNGDGTHSLVCKNDETHTSTVSCSGGTATCIDSAVCDACGEEYGAPLGHNWDNGTVKPDEVTDESSFCELGGTMIYTCTVCSITKTEITPPKTHTFVSEITAPTCSEKGYTTHTCSVCNYSYTDTETNATGVHVWDKDRTCTEGHTCTVCSTVEAPLTHVYKVTASSTATCEQSATDTYTCSLCGDHYDTVTAPAVGHNIVGVTAEEAIISGCEYSQHFSCTRCGEKIRGENVFHHSYSSSITKESTCSTEGTKLVKCSVCGDSYTEAIPSVAGNHVWNNGTSADGRIVYSCTVGDCNASKSVVDASDKTEVDVKVDDLASSGGVQFEEATLDMSEVTGSLEGEDEVTLSAGTLKDEELEAVKGTLTKDQLAQLGSNSIYNFTMSNSSGLITDFGNSYVTVTIPYQLSEGEDVDSIAVWYMSEDELVSIKATYNNGYVTFVTNHFSYYSVTRLTPKERCDLYGHIESRKVVEATCVKEGYTIVLCIR